MSVRKSRPGETPAVNEFKKRLLEPAIVAGAAALSVTAREVTDRVLASIEALRAEQAKDLDAADLRWAVFSGVARHLTEELVTELGQLTPPRRRSDYLWMLPSPKRREQLAHDRNEPRPLGNSRTSKSLDQAPWTDPGGATGPAQTHGGTQPDRRHQQHGG
jgi:hypothetical protein